MLGSPLPALSSALINTVYSVVVANAGPSTVAGVVVTDNLPATLIDGSWACIQGLSTATCPVPGASTGNLNATVNLGLNQFLRFDVMADVNGAVGAFVTNTASVAPPAGTTDPASGNSSAIDQDPIVPDGIFANGFEDVGLRNLTIPGAVEALSR